MMAFALVFDEIGQLMRAPDEVGFVENSGSQTTEEAELSVFVDFAARAEQRGPGADQFSQRDQVVFVAAGAVKQQECGGGSGVEDEVHEVFSFQCSVFGELVGKIGDTNPEKVLDA